jgi:protein SCO1/2
LQAVVVTIRYKWRLSLLRNAVVCLVALIAGTCPARAIEKPGEVLEKQVGVYTQLGTKVDLNREFTNAQGERRSLKDFALSGKPIVIAPVYYKCPRLCGLLLDGTYTLLNQLPLLAGRDFSLLVVGFNPEETFSDAAALQSKFSDRLVDEAATSARSIQYLVGGASEVSGLMSELGFKFMKDGEDFAHSAALMILTPTGEISQYFTGIMFTPLDVRLSLVEASKGVIGTAVDHLLLYCFRFDPIQGKYTWAVVSLLRIGGILTLAGLGLVYLLYGRSGRRVVGV